MKAGAARMKDEKKVIKTPHTVIMEDRKTVSITGVMDIDSFDENTVLVFTDLGALEIKGNDLHINKIDVDSGELTMEGTVDSMIYSDSDIRKGGFFSRLFK